MLGVLDRILLCCIPGMLYVIYVLKHANRADFSTISIFVKTDASATEKLPTTCHISCP